jgi:dTDP-glucose 4,6-dehydratase
MTNESLKCMVLGSSSFGGGSFIDQALSRGMRVVGVSRSKILNEVCVPHYQNSNKKLLKTHVLDLNKDLTKIVDLFCSEKPDILVDFAGQGMVAPSWDFPEQWYQTNVVAKAKFINAIKNYDFLRKYIRISTPEVYGSTSNLVKEGGSINPSTPYAVSHAAIDLHIQAYFKEFGFPMIIGRFSNFYGSCQQLYRVIPKAFYYALSGNNFNLEGGGNSERSFIHREDFSKGILAMIDYGKEGRTYHFSNDEFISIRSLVQQICDISGVKFNDFVQITKDRRGKDFAYKMSTAFTRKELNWNPSVSLDVGLKETFNWIKSNLNELSDETFSYQHKE